MSRVAEVEHVAGERVQHVVADVAIAVVVGRARYRDLERLAGEPETARRAGGVNRLLGFVAPAPTASRDQSACTHRPKRGGGFVLEVNAPVEAMSPSDVSYLRDLLEAQLARVNARLAALGNPAG